MNDKMTANYLDRESAQQPMRIVVTRDPVTKEFIHHHVPLDQPVVAPEFISQAPAPAVEEQYYEPSVSGGENEAALPARNSKTRLQRQRIGHSVLFAATLSGMYVAGNYAVTGFATGKAPNVIEDVTQIPGDLANTYDTLKSTINRMQSIGNTVEDVKKFIPEDGDK